VRTAQLIASESNERIFTVVGYLHPASWALCASARNAVTPQEISPCHGPDRDAAWTLRCRCSVGVRL